MKRLCSFLLTCLLLLVPQGALCADASGEYVPLMRADHALPPGGKVELADVPFGPEGAPPGSAAGEARETLPVLDRDLASKLAGMSPVELVRVIIHLSYQPQDVIANEVRSRHGEEMAEIRRRAAAINGRYSEKRDLWAATDAENYGDRSLDLIAEDRDLLRAVNEDHEALSAVIKSEIAARLAAEVRPSQGDVQKAVERLGGKVEFGTRCVNALVAMVPAGSLKRLAEVDGVARLVGDRRMAGHLTTADDATRVDGTLLDGLWDDGFDGGLYDPAVLDSGTDLTHPGLEDGTNRSNFWSWFLVAGHADSFWDDESSIEDLAGHGTHVMGIVGSYGTPSYPAHLGMAFGIEKAVTLKAGWRGLDGRAYMFWSDAMYLMDRALYDDGNLNPVNSFLDDVDGLNLSYGGDIPGDEDDFSRFMDSIVSSYPDLVVTLSAGNSGPDNTEFNSPACAYNTITVANVEDVNTASRDDDFIRDSSTRGPTNNGRRKPDIAAPGTDINSCNTNWETGLDYIDRSGTSMSAPMVQGIAMDLMDAGVHDELAIKALLINTAQKNEGLIDFESDADGWSEDYGWGYLNARAAYYHRGDVIEGSVTARPNAGYYRLYKGVMHDEGADGEGRDRVTLAWNRHATYNPDNYPTTYYSLSDLNLRLYRESNETLIDTDLDADDNVHQVRVDPGDFSVDVVAKVYAWSTAFDHGGPTEDFALATEEGFVEVDLPTEITSMGAFPYSVEPNEEFQFSVYFINNSEIAAHNCLLDLMLPSGWTLVSGSDPFYMASVAGGGGETAEAVFTVRAQSWEESDVHLQMIFSHDSYGEDWTSLWYIPMDVDFDSTAPSPDPMGWAIAPTAQAVNQISMTSITADDPHQPVDYFFGYYHSPTGGSGGSSSGWQFGTSFTDSGLQINNQYGYRVKARDNAQTPNETGYSQLVYVYTFAAVPGTPSAGNPTPSTLDVTIAPNSNPSWTECAIYLSGDGGSTQYYLNAAGGSNGGTAVWRSIADWGTVTASGLNPGSQYAFRVAARNGDGYFTDWSSWGYGTTSSEVTDTVQATISASPGSGVVPFGTQFTVELANLLATEQRRVAGRIDLLSGGGAVYNNWRAGWTNLSGGEVYTTSWTQSIPALSSMLGDNVFTVHGVDVTPAPYNQPPYTPSGDSDSDSVTVTALAP